MIRVTKERFIEYTREDGWKRTYPPGSDLTGAPQEVIDASVKAWTKTAIDAYRKSKPKRTPADEAARIERRRRAAYQAEVDPLVIEAIRLQHTGEDVTALLDDANTKAAAIKERFPG